MSRAPQNRDCSSLVHLFGNDVGAEMWRDRSYGLLEAHVGSAELMNGPYDTDAEVERFRVQLQKMEDGAFAFLLAHSGYIPDRYGPDSSQETLHTKLTETAVAEWGLRVGMAVTLQKEKASKEDVTFEMDRKIAVCDAKSFRLGRSQKAPNVKDAVKQGDYQKWLRAYPRDQRAGGLVTFPSRHDWQKCSDVYLYASDSKNPILILLYEHLAFSLLHKDKLPTGGPLFSILSDYSEIFPDKPSKNRDHYWTAINSYIDAMAPDANLMGFLKAVRTIVDDAVRWAVRQIETLIAQTKKVIEAEVCALTERELRQCLVNSKVLLATGDYSRLLGNIRRFRQ